MLLPSRSRKNSEQTPLVQGRKKLLSLKMINPTLASKNLRKEIEQNTFFRLQKSLQKHCLQQQPVADPQPMIPNQQENKEQDRLWTQFSTQAVKVATKVERQRLNYIEKFFLQSKKEFQGYQQARRNCIQGLQGAIKQKYNEIHCFFEQIKQQKAAAAIFNAAIKTNKKYKKTQINQLNNNEKIQNLKTKIQNLRRQAALIEKEKQVLVDQEKRVNNQWIYFLKRFIKQGHYLKRGAIPILEELHSINCTLAINEMPQCLDDISKRCLLTQFNRLNEHTPSPGAKKRVVSESNSKMSLIAKKEMIKDVYKGTKEYLVSLVKQSAWGEPLLLPAIKQVQQPKQELWHENQKKRLAHLYTGEEYERARSILFGLKAQTSS